MSALTATVTADAGTTHAFFLRPEFTLAPARACHSLVRRLPKGAGEQSIRAKLTTAAGQCPSLAGVRVWGESLTVASDSPAAEARRSREARRAIGSERSGARVVVLQYGDGCSDLILVANRASAGRQSLDLIADLLADGGIPVALRQPVMSVEPLPVPTGPPPPWGLGDPRDSGKSAVIELDGFTTSKPILPAVLAATGLLLSRYDDARETTFPLLVSRRAAPDELTPAVVNVDEEATLGELLAAASGSLVEAGGFGDQLPSVGVVVADSAAGDRYLPCLAPVFPLTLNWVQGEEGEVRGALVYDRGAVAPVMAEQFARHAGLLAARMCGPDLEALVGEVTLVGLDEAAAILATGRTAASTGSVDIPIHTKFERLACAQPDAPALSDAARTLTYRELDTQADLVAAGLRALGVETGDLVGVCLERNADLVMTMLGVLKAGAAYVPMDPVYPAERLSYTADDAGIKVVVSTDGTFPAAGKVVAISAADVRAAANGGPGEAVHTASGAPAYVIYTSGSTGRPKGVAVPHRNVIALLAATGEDMRLGAADTWTLFHSSAFDFSVWEIWGCLLSGGHLIVVPYWVSRSPEEFHDLLVRRRVTVLSQTPSAFASLQDADGRHAAALALRLVVFGGEPLDARTLKPWFRRHPYTRCRMVNMFGITETTVHVTSQTITPAEVEAGSRTVGRALPGWSVSVRDRAGRLQPYGVPGEIYVGGLGLASYYLNQEKLTAERFIDDSVTGERVYRSGDLGLLRPDGRLDHLGRIDDQVKIRGFRIEPDEIRSVLLEDRRVVSAAVILSPATNGDAATARLDAYVVLRPDVSPADVRRRAGRYLPQHMIPATFTAVPELPLTVNGKVDADRLRELTPQEPVAADDESGAGNDEDEPESDDIRIGGLVLRVWRELLGPHIREDNDFFEAGGNSLLAVRLSGELRRAGLPALSLRDLYVHSTPAELSAFLLSASARQTKE